MRSTFKIGFLLALGFVILTQSCDKIQELGNETKISEYNDDESHNAGDNCMICHLQGGDGEGWFNVAGTVYDESLASVYPNSTIHLFTEANGEGTLVYTIEVDAKGNFYTTEDIDFGSGLYVSVEGTEVTKYMLSPVTVGACSSCHGSSIDRVWVK